MAYLENYLSHRQLMSEDYKHLRSCEEETEAYVHFLGLSAL